MLYKIRKGLQRRPNKPFKGRHFCKPANLGHYQNASPVIVQWDPGRDVFFNRLTSRALQIGLTPQAAKLYIERWIINISDVTQTAHKIKSMIDSGRSSEVFKFIPEEKIYQPGIQKIK